MTGSSDSEDDLESLRMAALQSMQPAPSPCPVTCTAQHVSPWTAPPPHLIVALAQQQQHRHLLPHHQPPLLSAPPQAPPLLPFHPHVPPPSLLGVVTGSRFPTSYHHCPSLPARHFPPRQFACVAGASVHRYKNNCVPARSRANYSKPLHRQPTPGAHTGSLQSDRNNGDAQKKEWSKFERFNASNSDQDDCDDEDSTRHVSTVTSSSDVTGDAETATVSTSSTCCVVEDGVKMAGDVAGRQQDTVSVQCSSVSTDPVITDHAVQPGCQTSAETATVSDTAAEDSDDEDDEDDEDVIDMGIGDEDFDTMLAEFEQFVDNSHEQRASGRGGGRKKRRSHHVNGGTRTSSTTTSSTSTTHNNNNNNNNNNKLAACSRTTDVITATSSSTSITTGAPSQATSKSSTSTITASSRGPSATAVSRSAAGYSHNTSPQHRLPPHIERASPGVRHDASPSRATSTTKPPPLMPKYPSRRMSPARRDASGRISPTRRMFASRHISPSRQGSPARWPGEGRPRRRSPRFTRAAVRYSMSPPAAVHRYTSSPPPPPLLHRRSLTPDRRGTRRRGSVSPPRFTPPYHRRFARDRSFSPLSHSPPRVPSPLPLTEEEFLRRLQMGLPLRDRSPSRHRPHRRRSPSPVQMSRSRRRSPCYSSNGTPPPPPPPARAGQHRSMTSLRCNEHTDITASAHNKEKAGQIRPSSRDSSPAYTPVNITDNNKSCSPCSSVLETAVGADKQSVIARSPTASRPTSPGDHAPTQQAPPTSTAAAASANNTASQCDNSDDRDRHRANSDERDRQRRIQQLPSPERQLALKRLAKFQRSSPITGHSKKIKLNTATTTTTTTTTQHSKRETAVKLKTPDAIVDTRSVASSQCTSSSLTGNPAAASDDVTVSSDDVTPTVHYLVDSSSPLANLDAELAAIEAELSSGAPESSPNTTRQNNTPQRAKLKRLNSTNQQDAVTSSRRRRRCHGNSDDGVSVRRVAMVLEDDVTSSATARTDGTGDNSAGSAVAGATTTISAVMKCGRAGRALSRRHIEQNRDQQHRRDVTSLLHVTNAPSSSSARGSVHSRLGTSRHSEVKSLAVRVCSAVSRATTTASPPPPSSSSLARRHQKQKQETSGSHAADTLTAPRVHRRRIKLRKCLTTSSIISTASNSKR